MKMPLPVPVAQPTQFSGERLRELRESKDLELVDLAKRLALSPAQLRQLENNQNSLFYSDAIRLSAARKVSEFLGEPLRLEPIAELPEAESAEATPMPQAPAGEAVTVPDPWPIDTARLTALGRLASDKSKPPVRRIPSGDSRFALSGWSAALCCVVLTFIVLLGFQAYSEPELIPVKALADRNAATPSTVGANEAPVSLPPVAALPVQDVSAAIPVQTGPVVVPVAALSQQPALASAGPGRGGLGCDVSNGPVASFTPARPDKDAAQIFVQGVAGQVVCIKDSRGQVWRHEFADSSGRTFFGAAPWLVESTQLTELQVYFQGTRARSPVAGSTRLRLIAAEPA